MRMEDVVQFETWEKMERPYPWTLGHFKEAVTNDVIRGLVLENCGEAMGFIVLQIIGEEAHVLNLMVNPARRREGWATRLLEKVLLLARRQECRTMTLDVDPMNAAAVNLYNKLGFRVFAQRKQAYPNGEDALLMRKMIG